MPGLVRPVEPVEALAISVSGAVQGVGFRPFVHALAAELGLAGEVRNTSSGVEIEVEGPSHATDTFLARLTSDAPPLALIEDLSWRRITAHGRGAFTIVPSIAGPRVDTLVTADAATCPACLRELFDPADRRYRYPFINCTNCGPRFTITRSVPYDRPATTMASFRMCPDCEREYHDPGDRRFHAQPNACPVCGPQVAFFVSPTRADALEGEAGLRAAVSLLDAGGTLAVKGLGGYHLASDATDPEAVRRLRRRKQRDEKPFAVMAPSLDSIRAYCAVSPAEEHVLISPRRPIVLLHKRGPKQLPKEVAPGVATYGFFLPYTPLHHLLLADTGRLLVMTSGNLSEEPIAYRDDEAVKRLGSLADGFLTHDRAIHMRTDDSVARVFRNQPYLLRRARGYAPLPVGFSGLDKQILAVGGHLKNTFCVTRKTRAFLSHHIGDLENLETLRSLEEAVGHFERLFDLRPEVVVHDLHPDYLSTKFARAYAAARDLPLLAVQHHEAHICSVLADTRFTGPVVGVAFDGAGYGPDGTVWGGEFFVGDAICLRRVGRLARLPLAGGDQAVREPWRLALALLRSLLGDTEAGHGQVTATAPRKAGRKLASEMGRPSRESDLERLIALLPVGGKLDERPWRAINQLLDQGLHSPGTSSAGRLFDAVSALLGLRLEVTYEGQAAVELEAAAWEGLSKEGLPSAEEPPPWPVEAPPAGGRAAVGDESGTGESLDLPGGVRVVPLLPFAQGVLQDLSAGLRPPAIAARFHHSLAAVTADMATTLAQEQGLNTVALSGGVFQNMLLLQLVTSRLEAAGLQVLVHRTVPANDGGLCLGQAEAVAARLSAGAL